MDKTPTELNLKDCIKIYVDYNSKEAKECPYVQKVVQNFIDQVENETLKNFVAEIITKKYKCGVNQKTVASILPEHFKIEHEVMLANKFKGELKEPVQITLKIDGNRCSALIDKNNNIKFLSRQGKEITGLKQIEAMLKDMRLQGYMLDGESVKINK